MSLPTVPDPPTNLMETTASTTSTSVAFSWTPPVNDGGLAITGYEIQWDQGTNNFEVFDPASIPTSYIFTGLNSGINYAFKVAAINSYGISALS